MIELGADVNAASRHFGTPLECACWRAGTELVKLLLERGADVNISTPQPDGDHLWPQTVLCVEVEGVARKAKRLLWDSAYQQAHELEIEPASMELLEIILRQGVDVDARAGMRTGCNHDGAVFSLETPLTYAFSFLPGVAAMLLEYGADPNIEGSSYTPLHYVCMAYDPSLNHMQALLTAGADVNAGEQTGSATPLQLLTHWSECMEAAAILLAAGAHVKSTADCQDYASAVYAAGYYQDMDMVSLLLAHGADALEAELGLQAALVPPLVLPPIPCYSELSTRSEISSLDDLSPAESHLL